MCPYSRIIYSVLYTLVLLGVIIHFEGEHSTQVDRAIPSKNENRSWYKYQTPPTVKTIKILAFTTKISIVRFSRYHPCWHPTHLQFTFMCGVCDNGWVGVVLFKTTLMTSGIEVKLVGCSLKILVFPFHFVFHLRQLMRSLVVGGGWWISSWVGILHSH